MPSATITKPTLAELARDCGEYQDGRKLLDDLSHATDGIEETAVLESEEYRKCAQRVAALLYAPSFTASAEGDIRRERSETDFMFPL